MRGGGGGEGEKVEKRHGCDEPENNAQLWAIVDHQAGMEQRGSLRERQTLLL
jgi:hypothetical protein